METGIATGINAAVSTAGYAVSYTAINNSGSQSYLRQAYREHLYSNNSHNYIHNYTSLRNSPVYVKATLIGDSAGTVFTEGSNSFIAKKLNKDEK